MRATRVGVTSALTLPPAQVQGEAPILLVEARRVPTGGPSPPGVESGLGWGTAGKARQGGGVPEWLGGHPRAPTRPRTPEPESRGPRTKQEGGLQGAGQGALDTHPRMHAHTEHARMHTYTPTYTHVCTPACVCTHMPTHTKHVHVHIHIYPHTDTPHACAHRCSHMCPHAYTR